MMFYKTNHLKNKIIAFIIGTVLVVSVFMAHSCTYNKFSPPSAGCTAADTTNVSYSKQVAPIIASNCFTSLSCHNGSSPYSGFRYDNYASLQTFLSSPYFPQGSASFINCIRQTGGMYPNMPITGGKLSNCDISKIVNWINAGYPNN